jgi:hypothetical protein
MCEICKNDKQLFACGYILVIWINEMCCVWNLKRQPCVCVCVCVWLFSWNWEKWHVLCVKLAIGSKGMCELGEATFCACVCPCLAIWKSMVCSRSTRVFGLFLEQANGYCIYYKGIVDFGEEFCSLHFHNLGRLWCHIIYN